MLRSDYRDRVIGKLANLSTNLPNIFSTEEINSAFLDTLRGLPYKGIYREQKWTRTLTINEKEYGLPAGTFKVELVEIDEGSTGVEDFIEVKGWTQFAGEIELPFSPSQAKTMRCKLKIGFTEITDDNATVDVPDDKGEVLVLGMVRRLLDNLINYMIDSANYDSQVKPSGATLPQVKSWRDEVRLEEERVIKSMQIKPSVRSMNMNS